MRWRAWSAGSFIVIVGCGIDPSGGGTSSGTGTGTGDGSEASSTVAGEGADETASADTTSAIDSTGSTTEGEGGSSSTGEPVDLDDRLRLDHVQVKGTHNSYHVEPPVPFDASHEYSHAPLPEQLDAQGVRAFELDVHRDLDGTISVYHILGIDQQTTCDTLEGCLLQIRDWSDRHPMHLPVVVWMEIKDDTGGLSLDSLAQLQAIDDVVTGVFPPARLLTPDEVQADYPTIRGRLQAEGWPTLGELRGRILVTILDTDEPAAIYTDGYRTLAGRPMFVRADSDQFDRPWAAIAKLGAGDADAVAAAHAAHMLIATNVCGADESDEDCFTQRQQAIDAGIHMLKDDFPAPVSGRDYWLELTDGNPAQCNPVTAPPECDAVALEDL